MLKWFCYENPPASGAQILASLVAVPICSEFKSNIRQGLYVIYFSFLCRQTECLTFEKEPLRFTFNRNDTSISIHFLIAFSRSNSTFAALV